MSITICKPGRASGGKLDKVSDRLSKRMRQHGAADPLPKPKTPESIYLAVQPKVRRCRPSETP